MEESKKINKKKDNFSFEQNLQQLEKIVVDLEAGNLSLEESISAFENGLKLAQQGQKKLSEIENRIKVLTQKSASAKLDNYANSSNNQNTANDLSYTNGDDIPF